jgi:Skp family chaperone for outer membrane proteins
MKTTERIVIYAILLTLSLLVLGAPLAGTVNAANLLQDLLGPADGVALRQDEGDNLVISAEDGRLTTGDAPYEQVYSVAVCDVVSIVQEYMKKPEVAEQLNAQFERARDELTRMQEDLQKLQEAMEMTTDPTQRQRIASQGQQMAQQLQQKNREAIQEQNLLRGEFMVQAYGEIVTAVNTVSDRLGIDVVVSTRDAAQPIEERDPNQILTNILARTAVRYPDQISITEQVMDELDLPVEQPAETPAGGPMEGAMEGDEG